MDFRRIDNDTVQCILSEEEMNSYGFGIEDFFSDQEKAREFLEHLVERAEEEIGYEAKGGMVSMQVMKMPNNDLVITFSDRDLNDGFQSMLQHIHQQLASLIDPEVLQRIHSQEDDFPPEAAADLEGIMDQQAYAEFVEQLEEKKRKEERARQIAPRLFRFGDIHALERFVLTISIEKPINSTVFYDTENECYYLLVKKGRLKLEEYQILCEQAGEFAVLCSSKPYVEQFCLEHFETVISKQAIRTLKNIETGNI